jgi:membrane-associated phospholipid phosphatase
VIDPEMVATDVHREFAGLVAVDFHRELWQALTTLGSAGLLLPLAILVTLQLLVARQARVAWRWTGCFFAAVGLVLATKAAFMGWGLGGRSIDFTGISGHALLALSVLPAVASVGLATSPRRIRLGGVACGLGLGVLVGVSRYVLGYHSQSEVIAGLALGGVVAALTTGPIRRATLPRFSPWVTLLGVLLIATAHYGGYSPVRANTLVVKFALLISGRETPFTR